jgi:hypothetical protein
MPRSSRSLALVLAAALAASTLPACGNRASGQAGAGGSAASKPARSAPSSCPSVEQVSQAAGFQVTFTQSIGSNPDSWMACQYELAGRYRGSFITITGEPASKADSVYRELKERVKAVNGENAAADRLDFGSGGWAFGADSHGEAAAVAGSHVYHVDFGHTGLGSMGDQKDAMVRVLKLMAH